jgi:hypothetical protein
MEGKNIDELVMEIKKLRDGKERVSLGYVTLDKAESTGELHKNDTGNTGDPSEQKTTNKELPSSEVKDDNQSKSNQISLGSKGGNSQPDDWQEESINELLYELSSKKFTYEESILASKKLSTLLMSASEDEKVDYLSEFLDYGGIRKCLDFMDKSKEGPNASEFSATLFECASKLKGKLGTEMLNKIIDGKGIALWKRAIVGVLTDGASVATERCSTVNERLWSTMASLLDAIAVSNGVTFIDASEKEMVLDAAIVALEGEALPKHPDTEVLLKSVFKCLYNLCNGDRKAAKMIHKVFAKKNLDKICLSLLKSLDLEHIQGSFAAQVLHLLKETLMSRDHEALSEIAFNRLLPLCFEYMVRFKACQAVQQNCFAITDFAFRHVVSASDMIKFDTLSTLAVSVIENDEASAAFKREVGKFLAELLNLEKGLVIGSSKFELQTSIRVVCA